MPSRYDSYFPDAAGMTELRDLTGIAESTLDDTAMRYRLKIVVQMVEKATGGNSFVEYTETKLFDGDGFVDRIRRNGLEWKMHSLQELLIRQHDYDTHKERFDEADARLQDLIQEHPLEK